MPLREEVTSIDKSVGSAGPAPHQQKLLVPSTLFPEAAAPAKSSSQREAGRYRREPKKLKAQKKRRPNPNSSGEDEDDPKKRNLSAKTRRDRSAKANNETRLHCTERPCACGKRSQTESGAVLAWGEELIRPFWVATQQNAFLSRARELQGIRISLIHALQPVVGGNLETMGKKTCAGKLQDWRAFEAMLRKQFFFNSSSAARAGGSELLHGQRRIGASFCMDGLSARPKLDRLFVGRERESGWRSVEGNAQLSFNNEPTTFVNLQFINV